MRIVGGSLRGRQLVSPRHQGLRPTSDRVREAVFNILEHGIPGFALDGARVLDLFAGTGALGIEALSRSGGFCLFVENRPEARAIIRTNVEALGLTGITRIFQRDATRLGNAGSMTAFKLAFIDPPYGKSLGQAALASLRDGGWLANEAVAVLEEGASVSVDPIDGFEEMTRRNYGDTAVSFFRFSTSRAVSPPLAG